MSDIASELTRCCWESIGAEAETLAAVSFTGEGGLTSPYAVTDFASAAVATAALAVAELAQHLDGGHRAVTVDRRLSSFWFGSSIRPLGWKVPPVWDTLAGNYRASDGWIRLHTNAPHHRVAAQHVLGPHADKEAMARAVAHWKKTDLETAVIESGGCAAEMRSAAEWASHAQRRAVAAEPLVEIEWRGAASGRGVRPTAARPLAGLRVLDLTRILAGPVASRFLAGYGAEVLRIDPPGWDEPAIAPEVTLGKRCARLNLKAAEGRAAFEKLLAGADIFLHGYRPGALDGLGYDATTRRNLSPGLIDVGLCAYGWSGPWAGRRGFDSLVQMSAGIAEMGMPWSGADRPVPLPVQALDHATGYLMAATAVRGVTQRLLRGCGMTGRLSLARTAKLLVHQGVGVASSPLAPETEADLSASVEKTDWGDARRLVPPAAVAGIPMHWSRRAGNLGSARPAWN